MIHIYEGDGKGKTTAAYGLCVRALGYGRKVIVAGFIKPDTTGEYLFFKDRAEIFSFGGGYGFVGRISKEAEENIKKEVREGFFKVISEPCFLLVLDEVLDAVNFGFISEEELISGLKKSPAGEIVLTGRNPGIGILNISDYHTHFEKKKHPYDCGINARKGIEF